MLFSFLFSFLRFLIVVFFFFFQAEDGIRDSSVTGVQTCALPIYPHQFLRSLIADLGIPDQTDDLGRMQRRLNEVLIREVRAGRRVVVVIDEAQNLEDSVLERYGCFPISKSPERN